MPVGYKAGGRKKGTPNKTNLEAKHLFLDIMNGQVAHIEAALEEIRDRSAYNYIVCLSKLMPYFIPKQLDITSDGAKLEAPVIALLPLDEDQAKSEAV